MCEIAPLRSLGAGYIKYGCQMHGRVPPHTRKEHIYKANTHLGLCGTVQVVEEDRTSPVHSADALPDTDAPPGLLISLVLKQRACGRKRQRRVC